MVAHLHPESEMLTVGTSTLSLNHAQDPDLPRPRSRLHLSTRRNCRTSSRGLKASRPARSIRKMVHIHTGLQTGGNDCAFWALGACSYALSRYAAGLPFEVDEVNRRDTVEGIEQAKWSRSVWKGHILSSGFPQIQTAEMLEFNKPAPPAFGKNRDDQIVISDNNEDDEDAFELNRSAKKRKRRSHVKDRLLDQADIKKIIRTMSERISRDTPTDSIRALHTIGCATSDPVVTKGKVPSR